MQPIALQADVGRPISSNESPALVLLGILFVSATLPLVMVSATAPLVQRWFALTGHPRGSRSVLPLCREQRRQPAGAPGLSVPDRAEPGPGHAEPGLEDGFSHPGDSGLDLRSGRLAPAISIEQIGSETIPSRCRHGDEASTPATWLRWLVLVFVPSSWLMGVTTYLTTDLAAIPLLWIIPLRIVPVELHPGLRPVDGGRGPRRARGHFPLSSCRWCWS